MNIKENFWLDKSLDLKYVFRSNRLRSISLIFNLLHLCNSLIIKTFASLK